MNRTQNVLATVAPSFLVTKTSLLCLGVKSISEMRMVQAQEAARKDGEELGRKTSQGPAEGQPAPAQSSGLMWVQNALELVVLCGTRTTWSRISAEKPHQSTVPSVALPLSRSHTQRK